MNRTYRTIATLALTAAGIGHAQSFRKTKIIDAQGKEAPVELVFSSEDQHFTVKGLNATVADVPYTSIGKLSYEKTVRRRLKEGAVLMVGSLGVGVALMFTKSKNHWFYVDYKATDGSTRSLKLKLDKGEYRQVLAAAKPFTLRYIGAPDTDSELIRRYLNAVELQSMTRRGVDVEVTIDARLPKLNKQATLRTLRRTSATGTITYTTLDARGDSMVRREVIARYLVESQRREIDEIAITPAHYRFRFTRTVEQPGRRIQVFQLTPKQKQAGLFRGELWLDGETGLPVHESGQFVRSPSVFVRRIVFVRDYQIRDGVAIPNHIASTVETRVVGRAELNIRFGAFTTQQAQNPAPEDHQKCQ